MKFHNLNLHSFNNILKRYFNISKKLLFLLSLSYLIYYLLINANEIKFENNFYNLNIYLSFLFCCLSIIFNGFAWKSIIQWFGKKSDIKGLVSFYILTNSLKYIPGGVWHFLERFNFLKKKINPKLAFYSILIEPYLMLSVAFLLIFINSFYNPFYLLFIFPCMLLNKKLVFYILMRLEQFKSGSLNIFKLYNPNNPSDLELNIVTFFPYKAILIEILFVISKFLAFIFCFNIFYIGIDLDYFQIFIIFCLSWSMGLIIPAAPGGLGVFEASYLFFSGNNYSQNVLLMTLIYFRFISTTTDLIFSAPFLVRKYLNK